MALLFTSSLHSLSSPSSSSISRLAAHTPFFRWCNNFITFHQKPCAGGNLQAPPPLAPNYRGVIVVKASSDVTESTFSPSDVTEPSTPEPSQPATLDVKLEQKLRMKLAKKIRLRRKRLVQKRHLRKKGRWPPSKMKKNKNV